MSEQTTVLVVTETSEVGVVISEVTPVGTVPIGPPGPAGVVQSIVAGTNVTVDDTDPANPVVSASGGGGGGSVTGIGAGDGILVDSTVPEVPVVSVDDTAFIPQGGPLTDHLDTGGQYLLGGSVLTEGVGAYVVLPASGDATAGDAQVNFGAAGAGVGSPNGAFAGGVAWGGATEYAAFAYLVNRASGVAQIDQRVDSDGEEYVRFYVTDGTDTSIVQVNPDSVEVTHDALPFTGQLPVAQSLSAGPYIRAIATITQVDYDALSPPDDNTLYIIVTV